MGLARKFIQVPKAFGEISTRLEFTHPNWPAAATKYDRAA
jgi:hypothetical protein